MIEEKVINTMCLFDVLFEDCIIYGSFYFCLVLFFLCAVPKKVDYVIIWKNEATAQISEKS